MIGIAILGIGLLLGMPSYRIWIQNTHIRNASESIQQGMQRARAEAVSRNTNISFVLGGGPFWTISQVSDASVIESRPSGEISDKISLTILPVAVAPATAPTMVTFSSLGTVTANADGSVPITQIDIDSSLLPATESRELRITVGTGGIVRMCDPDIGIATTDPRHC